MDPSFLSVLVCFVSMVILVVVVIRLAFGLAGGYTLMIARRWASLVIASRHDIHIESDGA